MLDKLRNREAEKGFTLIEIVLVLAIAGLIMVIVFLAVSGAQRSRRDTQRKNDLSRVAAQLEQFASNSNGVYPTTTEWTNATSAWRISYINNQNLSDPTTGGVYNYVTPLPTCTTANVGTVGYALTGRQYTVRMCLEQGFVDRNNN